MGQASRRSSQVPDDRDANPYEDLGTHQLEDLVGERGIPLPASLSAAPDRGILLALLQAYDAGRADGRAEAGQPGHTSLERRRSKGPEAASPLARTESMERSVSSVLQKIRDAPGHMGCDIGGTLVKMVLALPSSVAGNHVFEPEFGISGRVHNHLELRLQLDDGEYALRFISGSTIQMERAVQALGTIRANSNVDRLVADAASPVAADSDAAKPETDSPTPPRKRNPNSPRFDRCFSDWSAETFTSISKPVRKMATAGGGACKFAPLFLDALRVELQPVKELSAMVAGLLMLAPDAGVSACRRGVAELGGANKALFTVDANGQNKELPWPDPLFPLILVIMGSGVSILQVNSADENDYERVAGTACGGGTFLGLARLLTSAETFQEALALAERGDAKRADKLVSDIYGEEGCANLGLAANLTACNFGKLCEMRRGEVSDPDLARSLLQMVTQQSALLASASARHAGCVGRVFCVGGFVDEANWMSRMSIAANLRNLDGCAYFLRHSDFLGALGSLKCALRGTKKAASPQHAAPSPT